MQYIDAQTELGINNIIKQLVYGKISKIMVVIERVSNHYFFNPQLDKEVSIPPNAILNALSRLEEENFLESTKSKTTYCIECFSPWLNIVQKCPYCGSKKVRKGRILAHRCGFKGIDEVFIFEDKLICPKCHRQLYMEGLDYHDEGIKYKCMVCGNISSELAKYYECPKCRAYYEEKQVPFIEIATYNPSPSLLENMSEIRKCFITIDNLFESIKALNVEVKRDVLEYLDQESYFWDVLAQFKSEKDFFKLTINTLPLLKKFDDKVIEWLVNKKINSKTNFYIVITHLDISQRYVKKLMNDNVYLLKAGESISELMNKLNSLLKSHNSLTLPRSFQHP